VSPVRHLVPCALLAAVLLACGVPADSEPRRLAAKDVPFGLLEAAPSTPPPTAPPAAESVAVDVFFLAGDRLRAANRNVIAPPTVGKVVNVLLEGVREEEAAAGLRSAINPQTKLLLARLAEGVARVDLSRAFAQATIQDQIVSLAQVVFTATAVPGVAGVLFTLEGEPVEVPTPDGSLASGPLGRDEFALLAPA
jgi:hypothetical protein